VTIYKLYNFIRRVPIQLYQKSSAWCFATHTHLPWANSSVAHGSTRNPGDNWWRNGSFPRRITTTDRDPKDGTTQRALRLEESNFRIPDSKQVQDAVTVRSANTRRSAGRDDGDQYADPCPAVRRRVDHSQGDHPRRRRDGASVRCEVSDVTRSNVTLSWLAPTSNGGAAVVAYVIGRPERLSSTWTQPGRDRGHGDSQDSTSPVQSYRLFAPCLQWHFRFVSAKDIQRVKYR